MRRMGKLLVPVAIVVAVAVLAANSAQAATATIKLKPAVGHPSAVVKVTGSGFAVATAFTVTFEGSPVATGTTDAGGGFTASFTVPASATPGKYTVAATAGATSAHKTFTVETDWNHLGFDNNNTGWNPYENVISPGHMPSMTPTWSFTTAGYVAQPAIVGGVAYFGSTDHNLYAVDIKTGAKLWSFTGAGDNITTTPVVVGPTVYFGSIDDFLYAVDKATGMQQWKQDLNGHVVSSPTVSKGTIYVGSNNHEVIALDSAGNILWATPTGGNVLDSPTVVKNVVYVGSSDDTLYALNAGDGSVKWHKTYANPVQYSPVYSNGILYFSEGTNLRAVKASSGGKVWTYAGSSPASGPAVADGHVYFGCSCGLVTSLNAASGTQDWQQFVTSSTQQVTVANGVLFVPPSGGSDLDAVATSNGALVWHVSEGTPLSGFYAWTAPAVSDGVVYGGATDGNLYAFTP